MKNIVNIINFVRGLEPRLGRDIDLVMPIKKQIELLRKHNLKGTFLMQYDAMLDKDMVSLVKGAEDVAEIGIWFETVQPQVEAAGEKWRGRYPWDWYCDVGFLMGYEPETRRRIIDEGMEKFKEIFGYYPKSAGSWHIDAVSMKYLDDKYNLSAICICRDQVGTDGYTMEGGYFNQAYYPSVNNMFCPAHSKETQINVPVFRMLGSDAIYEYDYRIYPDIMALGVPTLEPCSANYGGNREWCSWFLDETFCGNGLSFQYTQAGQENSFGWPRMEKGFVIQHELLEKLRDEGKLEVLTMSESGDWYKSSFEVTPPATLTALTDMRGNNKKSVWYNSRFYRANLLYDNGIVRIRDMYIFDDKYEEYYLKEACETHSCQYRNLPVMDSVLYTAAGGNDTPAGIYFTSGGKNIAFDDVKYEEKDNRAIVTLCSGDDKVCVVFDEKGIEITGSISDLVLKSVYDKNYTYGNTSDRDATFGNGNNKKVSLSFITDAKVTDTNVTFTFDDVKYGVSLNKGHFTKDFCLCTDNGCASIEIVTGL